MSFITVAAIGGLVGTGISAYKSIHQSHEAGQIDKNNPRPDYTIPEEYQQNLNIANQMAQQGIPQQQYNNQINDINQNQAAGLSALSKSANPGAGVASAIRQGNSAMGALNGQDAAQRENNLRYAMQVRGDLAQQKLAQQQYDKFDKYTEQFNKAAALRSASNQNLGNAINGATSMAGNLAGSGLFYNSGATMGQVNGNPYVSASDPSLQDTSQSFSQSINPYQIPGT